VSAAISINERAYRALHETYTFVVLDAETCDADDGRHIIQVATTTIKRGRVAKQWSTLVNPGVPITNTKYHHLSDADVVDAPPFAEVVAQLEAQLAGDDVIFVAHNASFDVGVLRREYDRLGTGRDLIELPVLDTMFLPQAIGHTLPDKKLTTLLASFGLVNAKHHDATADAAATAQALLALLKVAAAKGFTIMGDLLAQAGGRTTHAWATAAIKRGARPARQVSPIDLHIASHGPGLKASPSKAALKAWVDDALECARQRCPMLVERAEDAIGCAPELHKRLSACLKSFAANAEPGQGATLVGALSMLVPASVKIREVRPWWTEYGPLIKALPRCSDKGACPDCEVGLPCPLDVAHQPLALVTCELKDGKMSPRRRVNLITAGAPPVIVGYCQAHLYDLAGYIAWVLADSYDAEGNGPRALIVIDTARQLGASDPRLTLANARRLADQRQDKKLRKLVETALVDRNTDPAWADLADWFNRYNGQQVRRLRLPSPRPGVSARVARPAGRVRPQRFSY
jgi:DNA polymerase III epsilon subunit family exonuclease